MDLRKVLEGGGVGVGLGRSLLVSSAALQHKQKLGKDVCRLDGCI